MSPRHINDPLEASIAAALEAAGVTFVHESEGREFFPGGSLDFFLPDLGIYIEIKRFHSDRIAEQMSRAPNVIVAQGKPAVDALATMIRSWTPA